MSPNNALRLGLLNAQSINNKSLLICDLISDNLFDVMVLTETWHMSCSDVTLRRAVPTDYGLLDAP